MLDLRHLKDAPVAWNAHEYFAAEVQRTYGASAREEAHQQKEITARDAGLRISSALLTATVADDTDAIAGMLQ